MYTKVTEENKMWNEKNWVDYYNVCSYIWKWKCSSKNKEYGYFQQNSTLSTFQNGLQIKHFGASARKPRYNKLGSTTDAFENWNQYLWDSSVPGTCITIGSHSEDSIHVGFKYIQKPENMEWKFGFALFKKLLKFHKKLFSLFLCSYFSICYMN